MTRQPKPPRAEDWQRSNPQYQSGGVRKVRVNGHECVEIDAALLWDRERNAKFAAKGRRHA